MISSGDSIAGDEPFGDGNGGGSKRSVGRDIEPFGEGNGGGGGGRGGSKRSVGRDSKPGAKVKAGHSSSSDVGSLRKLMQGRTHFDDDSDGDGGKGSPPVASRASPPPPPSKRKGRHRRRRSNGSISSLMEVESVGIVASSTPTGPPAEAAAAGTGVVARAVARVEEGPPVVDDGAVDAKKAMTVGTPTVVAKEMPEDAASVPRRIAMLKVT